MAKKGFSMKLFLLLTFSLVFFQNCKKDKHSYDYDHHRTSYFHNLQFNSYNDTSFKCLTYNIQLGFTWDQDPWDADQIGATAEYMELLVKEIKMLDPDVIALQEVPRNRINNEIKNFIEHLAQRLNMNYAFGSHAFNGAGEWPVHGEWGNAVLSKYPILSIDNIEVSRINRWGKRSILGAKLKFNDTLSIHVISLHYGLTDGEYFDGIKNTRKYITTLGNVPVVLMGDFNPAHGFNEIVEEFKAVGLADADTSYYLHWGDRILFSKDYFTSKDAGSYFDRTSDHPANFCTLNLKK